MGDRDKIARAFEKGEGDTCFMGSDDKTNKQKYVKPHCSLLIAQDNMGWGESEFLQCNDWNIGTLEQIL